MFVLSLLLLLLAATPAMAHEVGAASPTPQWTMDVWIFAPIMLAGFLFALGSMRLLWRSRAIAKAFGYRAVAFAAGWCALVLALLSPLHWLGERSLLFHMIEHESLMAVAAPLIVAARPLGPMLWALPQPLRRSVARMLRLYGLRAGWALLTGGLVATLMHGAAIWIWHLPKLFDAAVETLWLHRLQHLSFFGTAVLFWWAEIWRCERGEGAWHTFVTMLHTAVLGALMALAPRALYDTRSHELPFLHLSPLEDQQMAGLVMWIPAGTIYAGAALTMLSLWVMGSSREADHADPLRLL